MSQQQHLSADLVADLLAGVLPATEALPATTHLAVCAQCADLRDALLDVTALLADEGAKPCEIPADVVASLDAALALAAAERASGVVSLDEVRRSRGRRPLTWLAGAAAAVAVAALGAAGLQHLGSSGSSSAGLGPERSVGPTSSGQAPSAQGTTPTHAPATSFEPSFTSGPGQVIFPVTAPQLPASALRLARHPASRTPPSDVGCRVPARGLSTAVSWQGHLAVLDVLPSSRTASILDCATAAHTLLTVRY